MGVGLGFLSMGNENRRCLREDDEVNLDDLD